MNCQDFEKLVLSLARNRLLAATEREQGLVHAEVCNRCAARLAEERALLAGVHAVVAELDAEQPPARIEAALLTAFHAHVASSASSNVLSLPPRTKGWSGWRLAAVAAGILLLFSAMTIFWRSAIPIKPRQEDRAIMPKPVGTPGSQDTRQKQVKPQVDREQIVVEQQKSRPKHLRRRAPSSSSGEEEVVTQFFPLREGEDLTALASLRLVRVELPGSALSEVGLPVDPETVNVPVKADVVLGEDGLARAIRFVR